MAEAAPLVVLARPFSPEPVGIQPLIERLLGRRRVLWVNLPASCRYPRPLPALRLGLQPLRRAGPSRADPADPSAADEDSRLTVIDPPLQPGTPAGFRGAARRRIIARALRPILDRLGAPPVVLTTLPHTAELIDTFPARRWIYYMTEPDATTRSAALAEMEAEQLRRVDAVAAATPALGRRANEAGREPTILPPGVDPDRWAPPEIEPPRRGRAARRLAALPEPRALHWGPPDAELDPEPLRALAARWAGSVALIGPSRACAPALAAIPGIHCLGPAPERDLPRLAALADVLILPHADEPADAIHPPPQLLPYLATGRATVCRDAPALREWAECCDLVPPERFADRVAQRAVTGPSAEQLAARQRRLPAESWEARLDAFESLLDTAEPVIRASTEDLTDHRPTGPSPADRPRRTDGASASSR